MELTIQVSPGELLDRFTILKIKRETIEDPKKLKNIEYEYNLFERTARNIIDYYPEVFDLQEELYEVNLSLWNIEDTLRDLEKADVPTTAHLILNPGLMNVVFTETDRDNIQNFIKSARQVYILNDKRYSIKNQINILTGSILVEEKSYGSQTI